MIKVRYFIFVGAGPSERQDRCTAAGGGGRFRNSINMRFLTLLMASSAASSTAAPCPSLQDLFYDGGLDEQNLYDFVVKKSSHVVGNRDESQEFTYSDPGDQDLWHANPLTQSKSSGGNETIGTSSGLCNLLTPSDNNSSQCLTVFTFEEYGTLVLSSLWPNNIAESGQLIVIGGTDCFENIVGTISVVATDDSWEYFHYELVDDQCGHDVDMIGIFDSTIDPSSLYKVEENRSGSSSGEGNGLKMGDQYLWHDNRLLLTNTTTSSEENQAGLASGSCMSLSNKICIGFETFVLSNGSRTTQVMFNTSEQEIVGGTNCFLGEKGGLILKRDESSGLHQYSLNPDVKNCDNFLLEDILAARLYEYPENNEILSASGDTGTGDAVGDTMFWIDNPVHFDLVDGPKVGTMTGMCNVLPPDGNASLCLVRLHRNYVEDLTVINTAADFGGGSTTFIGIMPNADDTPGLMALVSGTGCFSNHSTKSLYYTRKEGGSYYTIGSTKAADSGSSGRSRSTGVSMMTFAVFLTSLAFI